MTPYRPAHPESKTVAPLRDPLDTRPGRRDKTLPRGVYHTRPGSKRFKALGRLRKRLIYLGTFDTIEAASAAALAWRKSNAAAHAWYKASKASNRTEDARRRSVSH